jgi:prohibitin 2
MNAAKNFAQNFASKAAQAAKNSGGGNGGGGLPSGGGGLLMPLLAIGGLTYGAYKSVVIVQPGHKGVLYNRIGGLSDTAKLTEGMNFIVPWFQRPIIYNIRVKSQVVNTSSGSKDLQMVQISLRVVYKPDPSNLQTVYRTLGQDYDARVLPSIVNEIVKAVVAQYNASELMTLRDQVSHQVKSILQKRASDFKIVIDDVSITHLAYSRDYAQAVEAKQVAQQEAERAKYIVERAMQEKKATVIRAEGEARSAQLIGDAIKNNPAFVQLRRIEAAKEVAEKLATSPNKVYLNSDTLLVNTLGEKNEAATKKSGW